MCQFSFGSNLNGADGTCTRYRRPAGNAKRSKRLMKTLLLPLWALCAPFLISAQVGIGTQTPNLKSVLDLSSSSQGFLVPRLTGLQRSQMNLSAEDIGMMVFQTDASKGIYYYDGSTWVTPPPSGTTNGQTMRWDGSKWAPTNNLFNQGSSIGIGTISPYNQLHIHSGIAPNTRIQFTNNTTGALSNDGLVVGVSQANGYACMLQYENKPIWFGTGGSERMRIDSVGNVGIGRANPAATLDVNGTIRIGPNGCIINNILKQTVEVEIQPIAYGAEGMVDIPFSNTLTDASVYVSPGSTMEGLMIAYARVSSPGHIEVKFMNMNPDMDEPMTITLHVSVIQ